MKRFEDLFRNITHHFEIPGEHVRLEIESRIKVQNLVLRIPEESLCSPARALDDLATKDATWEFLQESLYVSRHPELWRKAVDLSAGFDTIYERVCALMDWIHGDFEYEAGATQVTTHLEEAFSARKGVCQDFTHVLIGLCRAIEIPARYASGYLYNGPSDDLLGSQASHAWAEVFFPGFGWVGFDPTNNTLADGRYIKVAIGRDYDDVAPIKGNYRGSGQCRMNVTVEVERLG